MALLFHDAQGRPGAAAAKAPAPDGHGFDVPAIVARWHLDAEDFQVRVHELCDGAGFAAGSILVTVTNRRLRASRTYLSRAHPDEWISEFERDLRAGVFSP